MFHARGPGIRSCPRCASVQVPRRVHRRAKIFLKVFSRRRLRPSGDCHVVMNHSDSPSMIRVESINKEGIAKRGNRSSDVVEAKIRNGREKFACVLLLSAEPSWVSSVLPLLSVVPASRRPEVTITTTPTATRMSTSARSSAATPRTGTGSSKPLTTTPRVRTSGSLADYDISVSGTRITLATLPPSARTPRLLRGRGVFTGRVSAVHRTMKAYIRHVMLGPRRRTGSCILSNPKQGELR